MHRQRGIARSVGVLVVLATIAAGCRSGGTTNAVEAPASEEPHRGGTVVIGAGDPLCTDWYGQCGSNHFGIASLQTLPSPLRFVDGSYEVTPLLSGEPLLDAGPPQRVTYRINPQALWSDGTPITSADFKYSWEQGRPTNVRGMADIAEVDDTDPRVAIVTWRQPSATWRDRFRPILPKHLLEGKDRATEMKDGYKFSGGPWLIEEWTRGQQITFVRNPRYWGPPTYLDSVVLRTTPDPGATRAAYKTGQIDAFVGPGAEAGAEDMRTLPDTAYEVKPGLAYSFLAFNTQRPPLDRKAVRQALGYATDRDAIVTQLQYAVLPGARPIQALVSEINRGVFGEPFARYRRDLTKVTELMRADGWTRGPDGVWAQGPQRATVELSIEAGPKFHALVGQIIESQWKEAGFDATVRPVTVASLNGEVLPRGNYQAVFTGAGAAGDPGQCVRLCSKNIPTEATRFVGFNTTRISSPVLDDLWGRVDAELDEARRRELVQQGYSALAEEMPVLPLNAIYDVFVSNNRKVGGPVATSPPYTRLSEWFCRTACG